MGFFLPSREQRAHTRRIIADNADADARAAAETGYPTRAERERMDREAREWQAKGRKR